jgi:hypothetical protein
MTLSPVFEWVAQELGVTTGLGRPACRGIVRGALELALFQPEAVSAAQMKMVIQRLLADGIRRAGVVEPEQVCARLASGLDAQHFETRTPESPDEIFSRLIRR